MAEKSGFFDAHLVSGKYDRMYLADDFARFFASFIGNGIYGGKSNELMVQQKTTANMSVSVLTGQAFINGYFYENTEELSLSIDVADGVQNRIDLIVLRWDNVERVIRLAVKKGNSASSPSAPRLVRDADFYELKLAEVYVKAGTTSITQMDITDTRLNSEECGFVVGVIEQFDTTSFGMQLDSFIKKFEIDSIAKMEEVLAKLNEVADANDLASLILDIERLEDVDAMTKWDISLLNQTLGYTKKNLIPYPYKEGTKVINGVTFTVKEDGTVIANGTPTADVIFALNDIKLDATKKYIITDGLSNSGPSAYYVQLYNNNAKTLPASYGNGLYGVEFTPEDLTYTVRLVVKASVSNLVFKPMIRRAEIVDNTWEPYKLSVAEMIQEDEIERGCFYRTLPGANEKEWINPPKVPGVEYRLTERWNGKVLYQKAVSIASLPDKSLAYIDTHTSFLNMLFVDGYAYNATNGQFLPFPVYLEGKSVPSAVINKMDPNGYILLTTTEDMTAYNAEVVIKYTKR